MKKSVDRIYGVNIPSLKNGEHELHFEIRDAFFEAWENEELKEGSGECLLGLKKSETMMQLTFELDLKVRLVCDRSLESFDFPIKMSPELIVKFGEHDEEMSEDLIVIQRDTQIFNIAPYLHEFISLSIPMKKLHPKFDGQDSPDMVYQLIS